MSKYKIGDSVIAVDTNYSDEELFPSFTIYPRSKIINISLGNKFTFYKTQTMPEYMSIAEGGIYSEVEFEEFIRSKIINVKKENEEE